MGVQRDGLVGGEGEGTLELWTLIFFLDVYLVIPSTTIKEIPFKA